MPLSAGETGAAFGAGIVANAFVIVLGFTIPLDHPALRNPVDNALLTLGLCGLAITALLWSGRMMTSGPRIRWTAATYAALSAVAVVMADFGTWRSPGWIVKALAVAGGVWIVRSLLAERAA